MEAAPTKGKTMCVPSEMQDKSSMVLPTYHHPFSVTTATDEWMRPCIHGLSSLATNWGPVSAHHNQGAWSTP